MKEGKDLLGEPNCKLPKSLMSPKSLREVQPGKSIKLEYTKKETIAMPSKKTSKKQLAEETSRCACGNELKIIIVTAPKQCCTIVLMYNWGIVYQSNYM